MYHLRGFLLHSCNILCFTCHYFVCSVTTSCVLLHCVTPFMDTVLCISFLSIEQESSCFYMTLNAPKVLHNNSVKGSFAMHAESVICTGCQSTKKSYPVWNCAVHQIVKVKRKLWRPLIVLSLAYFCFQSTASGDRVGFEK